MLLQIKQDGISEKRTTYAKLIVDEDYFADMVECGQPRDISCDETVNTYNDNNESDGDVDLNGLICG